jgi:hypothetical protein
LSHISSPFCSGIFRGVQADLEPQSSNLNFLRS